MATRMTATKQGELPIIKFGVYGAAGQGKTTLLSGFHKDPRTGPALWLNCGGNPNMLLKHNDVDFIINLDNFQDFLEPINFLLTGQPERHPFRKTWDIPPDYRFKSLVIDTFSDLQGLLIDSIVGIRSDELEKYSIERVEVPTPNLHGKAIAGKTLFAARQMLLALDLHVFTAFQEHGTVEFSGEEGSTKITAGAKKIQISLWGQSRMRVPTWLNLMGRMYWQRGGLITVEVNGRKVQRPDFYPVISWIDDESHVKNQLADSLGEMVERPTAEKLLNLIEQG